MVGAKKAMHTSEQENGLKIGPLGSYRPSVWAEM
jgi:hypothetical protein